MSGIKKYLSFFRIRFINGLQYRAAALAGVATQFAWGIMLILMYKAFYDSNPAAFPMTLQETVSYVWLHEAFLVMFMTWFLDNEILSSITNGNVAYELSRPMDIYSMWFTRTLATRLSRACLRCAPILLIAAFLPSPLGLGAPQSAISFILFIVTLFLGLFTVTSFCMLIYIATFHTMSPIGLRIIVASVADFLAGGTIPQPFMPDWLRAILDYTPFAGMSNLPFRVYSGNIAGEEAIRGIILQIAWLVIMTLIGKIWIRSTLKRVVVQGG